MSGAAARRDDAERGVTDSDPAGSRETLEIMASGHTESFRSHANYIHAFTFLCKVPYLGKGVSMPFIPLPKTLAQMAPVVAAAPSISAAGKANPDRTQEATSLRHAWGTELILAFGRTVASEEELIRLMNNWAVVQTYYTAYHALQALAAARGFPRPQTHPKTQTLFAALWADRPLDLPPWSFAACDGGWRNGPGRAIDIQLSPWSQCDPHSCWDLAGNALRTTRRDKVKEALNAGRDRKRGANRKAWLAEEQERIAKGRKARKEPAFPRPLLNTAEKRRIEAGVRSYTLLDYLYRLRVKTNYEDAGMFIEGPEDEVTSRRVHNDLITLASCTMLLHELHIGAIVGKSTLLKWVDEWLAHNSAGAKIGLGLRRDLLDQHLR